MLIFISDLHFVDGTAGEHNVPTDAFRIFFADISAKTKWLKKKGRNIDEIKIVFLGDIFDLLRTENWFEFPVSQRPWGHNESKIEGHAITIFDAIVKKNRQTFDLLGGDLRNEFDLPVEPERVYVPGNHDRLCNKYESLQEKVCKALGLANRNKPFEHYFEDVNYGVFARHGHEYDKFNYEGGIAYRYKDYMRVPIGDPITTELVAKLPWKIMQRSVVRKLPKREQEALQRNFQDIENVRPLSAVIEWLLYQVKKNLTLKDAIEDSVDEVIKEFSKLPFVKKWYGHHDEWSDFWDEADQIQSVLFLLKNFKVFSLEKIIVFLDKVKKRFAKDDLKEGAAREYTHLDNRIRYVICGHTHVPLQAALREVGNPAGRKEHVYLNSGTWRTRYHKCSEGLGFIEWKNLSYVIFYAAEEREKDFPTYETWTGTLKNI